MSLNMKTIQKLIGFIKGCFVIFIVSIVGVLFTQKDYYLYDD